MHSLPDHSVGSWNLQRMEQNYSDLKPYEKLG